MPTYFLILFLCSYCSSLSLLQLRHKSLLWFPSPCHFLHSTSNSATVVSLSPVEVILKRNLFTRWILHHRRRQRETANYLICKDELDRKTEDTHTQRKTHERQTAPSSWKSMSLNLRTIALETAQNTFLAILRRRSEDEKPLWCSLKALYVH